MVDTRLDHRKALCADTTHDLSGSLYAHNEDIKAV